MRGGPFLTHVISAIDMALWDITGKLPGVPVYRLLGGPTRDKIRMYPTPKAQKPGTGGPNPWSGNPEEVQRLVKMVKDARERVGADGAVMFDAHTGSISQMKKIAVVAEAYNVPLAPHSTCSELGLSASLHVAASVPHLLIHEGYQEGMMLPGVATKEWAIDKDGYASLPQGNGLGVVVDEKRIAEAAAEPHRKYKWPKPKASDGSVIDY